MTEPKLPRGPFTLSQVMGAQLAVEIAEKHGEEPDPDMVAIANAVPVTPSDETADATAPGE